MKDQLMANRLKLNRQHTFAIGISALALAVHTSSELYRLLSPLGWSTPAAARFFAQLTHYEIFSSHWKLKLIMGFIIASSAGLRQNNRPKGIPIQTVVTALAVGLAFYVGSTVTLKSAWLLSVFGPLGLSVGYMLMMGTGLGYLIKGMRGLFNAQPYMDIDLPNPNLN